jgi:hypothetical protein
MSSSRLLDSAVGLESLLSANGFESANKVAAFEVAERFINPDPFAILGSAEPNCLPKRTGSPVFRT